MNTNSLIFRFILFVVPATLLIFSVGAFFNYQATQKLMEDQLNSKVNFRLIGLTEQASYYLQSFDDALLEEMINRVQSEKEVVYVAIINSTGEIKHGKRVVSKQMRVYRREIPVEDVEVYGRLGTMEIGINTAEFEQSINDTINREMVLMILMVFMLSLAIILFFSRRISQPTHQLTAAAHKIATGTPVEIPVLEREDELAVLGNAIRVMVRHLEEAQNNLQEMAIGLEQQVEQRTQELVKANLAKDEFLASMSHELRTPLTSIIGNVEFLQEGGICGSGQYGQKDIFEVLNSIQSAGKNQLALVNDILDMSKIESGKFTIEESPYNLSTLLKDIEKMLVNRAQDAGLELMVEQLNEEEYLLLGDGQRIGQILINLVGNAIKFTETGTVSLTTHSGDKHLILM